MDDLIAQEHGNQDLAVLGRDAIDGISAGHRA
jgi:hypothetical protein